MKTSPVSSPLLLVLLAVSLLSWGCPTGGSERPLPPPNSVFVKGQRLMPSNHTVDWMNRHGQISLSQANDCASCHTEQDCLSCHTEQLAMPYSVHPPNFVTVHAVDARANLSNCTDCHKVDTFCSGCHMETRTSPIPTFTPPPGVDFHPPHWLQGGHPNSHGPMARRNINDCASCHTENDCVTCHVNINPHPPEFRMDCRRWLEANPRPCATCHQDPGALRMMCQ